MGQTHVANDPNLAEKWTKLAQRLEQKREQLVRAGSVVACRQPGRPTKWVVRFREQTDGRVRQRSILCGDAVLAERARALIRSWRRAAFTPARERERLGRLVCSLVAEARHYSRRQRRSLLQQAQAAAEDPRKALLFAYRMQYPDELVRSRKRIGRPPRGRLF